MERRKWEADNCNGHSALAGDRHVWDIPPEEGISMTEDSRKLLVSKKDNNAMKKQQRQKGI